MPFAAIDTTSTATSTRRSTRSSPSSPSAPSLKNLLRDELGEGSNVDFEEDVEPILGNPFVVGATDVTSFLDSGRDAGLRRRPQGEGPGRPRQPDRQDDPREVGEAVGATKYEDGGSSFAVKDDIVIFAGSSELSTRRSSGPTATTISTSRHSTRPSDGLPDAALARVYRDLQR